MAPLPSLYSLPLVEVQGDAAGEAYVRVVQVETAHLADLFQVPDAAAFSEAMPIAALTSLPSRPRAPSPTFRP